MNRPVLFLVSGVALGLALGYGFAVLTDVEPAATGSTFVREFSFEQAVRDAAAADWEVLHDRTEPVDLGRSGRISRRFVARATLERDAVQAFARAFDEAVERALPHQSGEARLDHAVATPTGSALLQLPRYYYRAQNGAGIVDAGIVAEGGNVTVIVSMLE